MSQRWARVVGAGAVWGSLFFGLAVADPLSTARSCQGRLALSYLQAPRSSLLGDLVQVEIKLGAGAIQGGTTLSINRIKYDLDCNPSNFGINCSDDGPTVSYQGGLTTDCPVAFTSSHVKDDLFPNQVVFSPSAPLDIPAGVESYCTLRFFVRIEEFSGDGTPLEIEQVAGYDASTNDGVCNTAPPTAVGKTNTGHICLGSDCETGSTTCDVHAGLSYPGAPNLLNAGAVVRAHVGIDTGELTERAPASVRRVKLNLDCQAGNLGINCLDDGPSISYQGGLTSTCGVTWTSSHSPGDTLPNQVVFSPDSPLLVPPHTPGYCGLDFDLRVEARGGADGSPDELEQVIGMDGSTADVVCGTREAFPGGDSQSTSLQFCPLCDDGDPCNGSEFCDGNTGCAAGPPPLCDDHDACTDDSCSPAIFTGDPCVHTPRADACDDRNACTQDACDSDRGCLHADTSARCNDGNICTNDACDPARGCAFAPNGRCGANPRGLGYWRRLCRTDRPPGDFLTSEDVACVSRGCPFASVRTVADLCARLAPARPNRACAKAEGELLALELNVCRGRLSDAQPVSPSCGSATTVGEVRAAAEARLCDPSRPNAACRAVTCSLQ